MWEYNYTNYNHDELYHYGVKGMKWKNHTYATREELEAAKKKYKTEKEEFKADRKAVYKELKKGRIYQDRTTGRVAAGATYAAESIAAQRKKGQSAKAQAEYGQKVLDSALKKYRRRTIGAIAGSTAVLAGAAILPNVLRR